jgi:hypothetical protein
VDLFLDICQGIGLACAVGIRPFLPALLAGALARGDVGVDFEGTDYGFLEGWGFLLALVVGLVLYVLAERRYGPDRLETGPFAPTLGALGPALGALFFAGTLADHHNTSWPGLIAGALCALLAYAAIRSLFVRTRARLDADAAGALPLYAEGAGLACAGLSVLLPPLGLVALVLLAALLVTGRRREGQKYAGLRILR